MTPGEPERAERARRTASGVPLPAEAWASIVAAARSVGVNRDLAVLIPSASRRVNVPIPDGPDNSRVSLV